MTTRIRRRTAIAGLAATGVLAGCAPRLSGALPGASPASVFRHGVASGDPDAESVVLWTRVESAAPSEPVDWQVAADPDFSLPLASGTSEASAARDHTVKLVAKGLEPGRTYFYRFRARGETSPVGRTRTLPVGALERLGIALASCSNYPFGFFNAYDAIARDPGVDFVLHTGDYIYEYGADEWGHETGAKLGRLHDPAHEIVALADYRRRHAQYKSDAGSQAMHAAHPLLACWDDHESANNPWVSGAQNHQPETEGAWPDRRAAALQAYYEWMPVRDPLPGGDPKQFWRAYSFGDLASLVTLETRHTARGEQVDYLKYTETITDEASARRFLTEVIGDPDRRMLSDEMDAFLAGALTSSRTSGQPWRLIGNAIPMARTHVPDVVALGILPDPESTPDMPFPAQALAWKGKWNLPFYTDTWDGYAAARERFYQLSRDAGVCDLLVLTGDSHSFWANRLTDQSDRAMGAELGTAGITSPGDFLESGFAPDVAARLDRAFADHIPDVVWTDNFHQGYVRVELMHGRAIADYRAVSTVLGPDYRAYSIAQTEIVPSGASLDYSEFRSKK